MTTEDMTKKLDLIAEEILDKRITKSKVIDLYGLEISEEDLIEEMLNRNIEMCSVCRVWKESCEIDSEQQASVCFYCSSIW